MRLARSRRLDQKRCLFPGYVLVAGLVGKCIRDGRVLEYAFETRWKGI